MLLKKLGKNTITPSFDQNKKHCEFSTYSSEETETHEDCIPSNKGFWQIVDNYLDSNDNKQIESIVYHNFMQWHQQSWLSKYIYLEDLNLGSLLDQFLGMYFLQIVKKFVCINKINI